MPFAVYVLGMAIFSMGTTEMMLSGLLPLLSQDLAVSIPAVGLLVSGFALGMMFGGPVLTVLSLRIAPKRALLGLLALFVAGQTLGAIAPGYAVLMVSRVVAAMAMGAFFGVAASVVVGLAGVEKRARALSVLVGGLTIATVIGVPAATVVGERFGWRTSFWMVSVFAALSWIAVAVWVPSRSTSGAVGVIDGLRVFRRGRLWLTLTSNALALAAFLGIFSYISPIFTEVTGFSPAAIPVLQFLYGLGCIAGIALGGRIADRRPDVSLYAMMAASIVVLTGFALVIHNQIATVVVFLAFGFVAFATNPPMTARAMALAGDSPLGASANTSAFNAGIALGPWLGGLAIGGGYGFVAPAWIGVALAIASLAVAVVAGRSVRVEEKTVVLEGKAR
ncbi:MFS transporter [Fodinicola acaciae]|uniref:MFS transporter n=1 Tax=Fodinicola acaciae TaxID=2681555 RepID=UPI0013D463BC|nr:MFS transporter [Fodinicola acaciae]